MMIRSTLETRWFAAMHTIAAGSAQSPSRRIDLGSRFRIVQQGVEEIAGCLQTAMRRPFMVV